MKGNPIYPESNNNHNKSGRVSGSLGTAKKRVKNKAAFRPKMTRSDKKARATGGKKQKAGFLKVLFDSTSSIMLILIVTPLTYREIRGQRERVIGINSNIVRRSDREFEM
jgi:hypothetical protein